MLGGACSQFENGGSGGTSVAAADAGDGGAKSIMLFGVRVMEEGSFRKSASMNNLVQYEQPQDTTADVAAGYASDDVVHASARSRERKRGVPWTEEEHKLFLLGLQKVGKGDWRGISRNFVKTRTPTQVASHAQKYFLRRNNHNRRRRRSSLFDITTDTFMSPAMEDRQVRQDNLEGFSTSAFPVTLSRVGLPVTGENSINQMKHSPNLVRPIPLFPVPPSSKMADLNLNHTTTKTDSLPLSLNLSAPSPSPSASKSDQNSPAARHASTFQGMSGSFNSSSGDSIISVA